MQSFFAKASISNTFILMHSNIGKSSIKHSITSIRFDSLISFIDFVATTNGEEYVKSIKRKEKK